MSDVKITEGWVTIEVTIGGRSLARVSLWLRGPEPDLAAIAEVQRDITAALHKLVPQVIDEERHHDTRG